MTNAYNNDNLKYRLDDKELSLIDEAWDLLKLYEDTVIVMHPYRKKLIKEIQDRYTVDEYYLLEKIIDKLFWNLRYKVNPKEKGNYLEYNINEMNLVRNKLKKDNYYRSFINKIIIVDDVNKKILYKKMEGSAKIFDHNKFNLVTMTILTNRNLYEGIMNNKIEPNNIKLPKYYFQMDYGFPNINLCQPLVGSEQFRKKKIEHMYFCEQAENNWFNIYF